MRVLITGAKGQLGTELVQSGFALRATPRQARAITHPFEVIGLDRNQLDIADQASVQEAFRQYQPNVVVNAAAYTKVDLAETELEKAYGINVNGVVNLAVNCAQRQIPLIHLSTDYVFDGNKSSAYLEQDSVNPLGIYGKSKWLGEFLVRQICQAHIILRVSWVYGNYGHNFVKTIIRLAKERDTLNIVNDQFGCPTSTQGIAEVIYTMLQKNANKELEWGTYHFCEGPATTWKDFAELIVKTAQIYEPLQVKTIQGIATSAYPTPATRPANSVLACDKLIEKLKITISPWQLRLPEMIRGLYS